MTAPAPAHLHRRLIIAATVAALLAVVIYLVAVHTSLGQRFDNAALLGSQQQQLSTRTSDSSILERITADSLAVVLLAIAGLGVIRRRPRLGIGVAVTAGVAVVLTDLLRKVLLDRPFLVHSDVFYRANTFPSGHTATAIGCALALVLVCPPAWRGWAAVLAGSYAGFTAAAVQTVGWHRPSDAIGAAFLSFAAVTAVAAVLARWRPIGSGRRSGHPLAFGILGLVWVVAVALSSLNAARVLRFLADHSDSLNPTPAILNDAYQFSINLTIVVVATLLAAMLAILGPYDLDEPGG
jgi:membrane-associated phospholipid phosphatase